MKTPIAYAFCFFFIFMLVACNEEKSSINTSHSKDDFLCKIQSGMNKEYIETPCDFLSEGRNGSFSIKRHDQKPLLNEITLITVMIIGNEKAEVRGLSKDGINSRWGLATRSKQDRACWTGADFDICVYNDKKSEIDDNNNGA